MSDLSGQSMEANLLWYARQTVGFASYDPLQRVGCSPRHCIVLYPVPCRPRWCW
ncbi:hypothetical protein SMAC4_13848 [Sordaria macrospora]|uniref:uncharacterized protein n=1 Tax=Sordaria macrospora TaxID=5147 RepID=UPI002B2837A1|nr:hypothetical protein SMAC4_13848 [Sordaria macrospora]